MDKRYFWVTFLFLLTFHLLPAQSSKVGKKDLKTLQEYMSGTFNSEAQSLSDSTYFHVSLHMAPLWPKSKDGYWLYVEQAIATSPDKPYRQRVYHLFLEDDTTIISQVYDIRNPMQYTGAWGDQELLQTLTLDSIIFRQGCGIYLHRHPNGSFSGTTPGRECLSSLRGSVYATSEVTVYPDRLISWDRGWNENGVQVWGATKGAYVFVRSDAHDKPDKQP